MAQTFNINSQQQGPKDSGAAFKWLVRICGLAAIGGFFLPYLSGESGLEHFQSIIDGVNEIGFGPAMKVVLGAETITGSVCLFIHILAFIALPLIGLKMLLTGKYKGGPFTFILLFNIAAFVMFRFFGDETPLGSNWFLIAEIGYWVSTGALFAPFIGMFFFDKSI